MEKGQREKALVYATNYMVEFQEKNNITKQCIANCLYLLHHIRNNNPYLDCKVKSVYVTDYDELSKTVSVYSGHLVITFEHNDKEYILDPSYEFAVKKNKEYFFSVLELKTCHPSLKVSKEMINDLIEYGKYSEMMNNGDLIVGKDGEEYYQKQAAYVKEKLNLLFDQSDQ